MPNRITRGPTMVERKFAVDVFCRVVWANVVLTFEMLKIAALSVTRRAPPSLIDLSTFRLRSFTAGYRNELIGKRFIDAAPSPFARVGPVIVGLNGKFDWALKDADAVKSHGS